MNRLWSPIVVMPPPPAVPRWIVTNSRNTLCCADDEPRRLALELQILRREADRRERIDLACRRRSPSQPSMTRRRADRGSRGRSCTCGPIVAYGPDRPCPRRSRAPGWTIAVSWIDGRARRPAASRLDRHHELRLGDDLAVDRRDAVGARDAVRAGGPSVTSSSSRSPGTTCRRNFALSTPRSHARPCRRVAAGQAAAASRPA